MRLKTISVHWKESHAASLAAGLFLELDCVQQLHEASAGAEDHPHIGNVPGTQIFGMFLAFARNADAERAEFAQFDDVAFGQLVRDDVEERFQHGSRIHAADRRHAVDASGDGPGIGPTTAPNHRIILRRQVLVAQVPARANIITGIAPDELAYSLSDCCPYCGIATDYLLRKMITSSVSYTASKRGFLRIFSTKGKNDF